MNGSPRKTTSPRLFKLALGLSSALLLIALRHGPGVAPTLEGLEAITYDLRMRTRPTRPLASDLLLVGLTDFDLDYFDAPLRSHRTHYDLLETLTNLGVGAAVYDIIFADEREWDDRLAFQMALGPRAYLPYHFYIDQRYPPNQPWIEQRKEDFDLAWRLPVTAAMARGLGELHEAVEIKLPVPALMTAARELGHINVHSDADGVVRRLPLLIRYDHPLLGDGLYPSLSLAVVLDRLGLTLADLDIRPGDAIEFASGTPSMLTRIPINERGEMLINFREGRSFTERGLSVESMMHIGEALRAWTATPPGERAPLEHFEVYGHRVEREMFAEATVLVGVVAVGSTDIRAAAIDPSLPMITVHANAISSILRGDFVREAPAWAEMALTLLIGLLAGSLFGRLGYMRSAIMTLVLALALAATAWAMFAWWSLWVPLVVPTLTLLLAGVLILLHTLLTEERRVKIIREAFEAYTSPEVVEEILQNIDDPALWGAKRRITALFVDVRGFTTLTEATTPEVIVEILNEYYRVVVEAIQRHGGIPNKFIGDEVMALFNAPRTLDHAEEAACHAGIDIQRAVARLNREHLAPRLEQTIQCGVGINSGEAIVGIVGAQRIEYTALGDAVNIASRLQGQSKGGQVLVGEETHAALGDDFLETAVRGVRQLPEITLKGMTRRFCVHELCHEESPDDA